MPEIKLCISCKKNPIHIQKRGLCRLCYQRLRKEKGPIFSDKNFNYKTKKINKDHAFKREMDFVKNFFSHTNWIYQPALFKFNGMKYSPDFYDAERNVFIEVSGSRQAYHKSKNKYKDFRKYYPKIIFEIRQPDGSLLDEESFWKDW